MASASYPTPFLPLTMPMSPLVGGPGLSEDFFSTLVAQGTLKPLPVLSFSSASSPCFKQCATNASAAILTTSTLKQNHRFEKPLPSVPSVAVTGIPPRQIISLLDLLERMDNDMVKEVQRVRESIKEAWSEIAEYRHERNARDVEMKKRRARERRDTKGVDDEFWLQV
ncbi:hypothetical protein BDY19DRAFT_199872 [Irpex rosettiformis]|uniref:Uncharacterized protein n=1 Tax=Irpex rosettiformis TaxID=378272 RepID=A0ACB8U126_9APHY|nr:hypothetical protein BDY19DRAFT_199872 [Irpex rosettiformis]